MLFDDVVRASVNMGAHVGRVGTKGTVNSLAVSTVVDISSFVISVRVV